MSYQTCRRKMAPELRDFAFDRRKCRKAAFDSEGRDVRLMTFGLDWQLIRGKKEEILEEYTGRIQEIFDDIYERVTGGKRTSLDHHLLPTIKTPAIRKTQPRLPRGEAGEQRQESEGNEPNPDVMVTTITFEDETPANDPHTPVAASEVPEIVDVTNTSLCRTTRSRAKIGGPQLSKSGGENVHPATTTTTMKHTALTRQASVVGTMAKTQGRDGASDKENSSEDLVSATATSKCRTRARRGRTMKQRRATGGETQDVSELDVEVDKPVTAQVQATDQADTVGCVCKPQDTEGTGGKESSDEDLIPATATSKCRTRTRTVRRGKQRRATGREAQDTSELDGVENEPKPTQVQSTVPAVTVEDLTEPQAKDSDKESSDEDYVPAATTSKFRSRVRRVKQGQATGSEAKDVSELSSGEDKSMSTQVQATDEPEEVEEEVAMTVRRSTRIRSKTSTSESPGELGILTRPSLPSRPKRSLQEKEAESDDEVYAKPPPPKKSLKLRKKPGRTRKGRGRKKSETSVTSASSVLQEESSVAETQPEDESAAVKPAPQISDQKDEQPASVDKGDRQEEASDCVGQNKGVEDTAAADNPVNGGTPPNFPESMYESCVSEMEVSPVCDRRATCTKASRIPTPVKTPRNSPQKLPNTPSTVTKAPKAVTPEHQAAVPGTTTRSATVTKTPKANVRKTPFGETSTKENPILSPLRVPYLRVTPKSLHQLQEGHVERVSPVGGKVISMADLRASRSRLPMPTTVTKTHPLQQAMTPSKTPKAVARHLRSVSLERLPLGGSNPRKGSAATSSSEEETVLSPVISSSSDEMGKDGTQDEGGSSSSEKTDSDTEHPSKPQGSNTVTKSKGPSKTAAFWQLLQKKGEGVASKVAFANVNNNLSSFLPRNSPKKQDTFEARQEKLKEKIQRKKEEEERRKREMEQRKQQDLAEKIRKREERLKRVAEKQAALKREEEEKKKLVHGLKSQEDEIKKLRALQKRAKEMEEKNRKAKERKEAVENRRKQEEEQRVRRLQQIDEERTMAEELLKKRQLQEEEERRVKRQERQKQELERLAELERQEQEQRRKRDEGVERSGGEENRQHDDVGKPPISHHKKGREMKRFEQLIEHSTGASRFIQQWKQLKGTPEKTTATTPTTSAGYTTPSKPPNSKYTTAASYEMTPAEVQDPFLAYSNYDITELSDEDSTDDEDDPKKPVPLWAHPHVLNKWMWLQEEKMGSQRIDVSKIFPPEQLLQMPDLGRIFRVKRRRFYHRSSSAQWDSPMLKKSRQE